MLSKHLRTLRRQAGLTQYGLARKARVPRWKIANAELGERNLLPEEIEAIRKVLVDSARAKSAAVLEALDDPGRGERHSARLRSESREVA